MEPIQRPTLISTRLLNDSGLHLSHFSNVERPSTARDRFTTPFFCSSLSFDCLCIILKVMTTWHSANVAPCLCSIWLCQPALNCVSTRCSTSRSLSHAWPLEACPSSLHLSEVRPRFWGARGCFPLFFCNFVALDSVLEVMRHFSKARTRSGLGEMLKLGTDVAEILLVAGVLDVMSHLRFCETKLDLLLLELLCYEKGSPMEQVA